MIARLILLFFINGLLFSGLASATEPFDNDKYLKECGGRVYPKCDSEALNQKTIYELAKAQAIASKKELVVLIGADWCPPCVVLDRLFRQSEGEHKKLSETHLIVNLDGDASSLKALTEANSWSVAGYPQMFSIDKSNDKVNFTFHPMNLASIDDLRKDLIKRKSEMGVELKPVDYVWFPKADLKYSDSMGLSLKLLKRPIGLDKRNISQSPAPTIPKGSKSESALKYYDQGVFLLHGFHWVDAARSFRTAIELEPNFYMAYIMLSRALRESYAFDLSDRSLNPFIKAREAAKASSPSKLELAFGRYIEIEACIRYEQLCGPLGIKERKTPTSLVAEIMKMAMDEKQVDMLALIGQGSESILNDVLKLSPNHSGAHHYLVHVYENKNDYRSAASHAEKFVGFAPHLAHAHHMYGHILPKIGRWNDAVARFLEADKIHQRWFALNRATPVEDWHYEHNLNLLGHAYFYGGENDKAGEYWKRRCDALGLHGCDSYLRFLVLTGNDSELRSVIRKHLMQPFAGKKTVEARQAEMMGLEFLALDDIMRASTAAESKAAIDKFAKLKGFDSPAEFNEGFLILIYQVSIFDGNKQSSDRISSYIEDQLASGGFDSWSEAIFESAFLSRMATQRGHKSLAANIRLVQESVGFRCK